MTDQPTLALNDGRQLPQLGFGTYEIRDADAPKVVGEALDAGYWLIDTASFYENEAGVGKAIGGWSDIFLQTKIWNHDQGYERTKEAFKEALDRLGRDFVDMLLIHWPCPKDDRYVETWRAMIELREEGTAKSIGVSNFREEDLRHLIRETGVTPALNQIELHPAFQQREMRAVHDDLGIATQCWMPIGRGDLFDQSDIAAIADELGQPASAVVLRWHIQHGLSAIPRSSNPDHIAQNFAALSFELSEDQMARIDALDDSDGRKGPAPEEVNA